MPQNKMIDLNNHLFEQLERLNDEELDEKQLNKEIRRAEAISKVAAQIVNNNKIQVEAVKTVLEYGKIEDLNLIPMMDYAKGNQ